MKMKNVNKLRGGNKAYHFVETVSKCRWKDGTIRGKGRFESGDAVAFEGEMDDELCEILVCHSNVVFKLNADLPGKILIRGRTLVKRINMLSDAGLLLLYLLWNRYLADKGQLLNLLKIRNV